MAVLSSGSKDLVTGKTDSRKVSIPDYLSDLAYFDQPLCLPVSSSRHAVDAGVSRDCLAPPAKKGATELAVVTVDHGHGERIKVMTCLLHLCHRKMPDPEAHVAGKPQRFTRAADGGNVAFDTSCLIAPPWA